MHACVCVCGCVVFSLATASVLKWIYLVWQNIWQVLTHGIFMLCFGATILHAIYAHRHTIYSIYLYIYITSTIVAVYISGSWVGVLCGRDSCQQQRKAAQNGTKALNLAVHCAGLFKNICLLYALWERALQKTIIEHNFETIIHRIALFRLPACLLAWLLLLLLLLSVTEVEKILSITFQFCMKLNYKRIYRG